MRDRCRVVPRSRRGCGVRRTGETATPRASGYVEATEVRVAPEVGGRIARAEGREGDRVAAGDVDRAARHRRRRARAAPRRGRSRSGGRAAAPRSQAGARPEDIRQAQAQVGVGAGRRARRRGRARRRPTADLAALRRRCSRSTPARASSATTRRRGATWRTARVRRRARARPRRGRSAGEAARRRRAPQEIAAARARVAAGDAQIASLQKNVADATLTSPVAGIVTAKLVDAGEMVAAADAGRRRHRSRSRVGQRLRRRTGWCRG